MFCPMCGAPNEEEATYCANCGAALKADVPPVEPVSPEKPEAPEEVVWSAASPGSEDVSWPEESVPMVGLPAGGVATLPPVPPEEAALSQPRVERSPSPSYSPGPGGATAVGSPPVNGMAVAALVLGIAGLTVLPFISSIFAVIFGSMARREIRQNPGVTSGDGVAVAGVVLGWIGIGVLILALVGGGLALCGLCSWFGTSGVS